MSHMDKGGIPMQAFDAFAEWITELPNIEKIILVEPRQYCEIWIVVNNVDEATRYRIYELELEMYKRFPEVTFDWHLLDRNDRSLEDLITFNEAFNTVLKIGRK